MLRRRYAPQWAFGDTVAQKRCDAPYACAFFISAPPSTCGGAGGGGSGEGGAGCRHTITSSDLNLLTVIQLLGK